MNVKRFSAAALATACGLLAHTANADIELGEGLSVTGFVDMSFYYEDIDGADATTKNFAVDQVEVDFMYTGSNGVSAQVDIEYGESTANGLTDGTFVEQAFITKKVNDKLTVKAGRFLSYSGWETEEPTGLFQYSGAGYAPYFYGYYQQGVSALYSTDKFAAAVSIVADLAGPESSDVEQPAIETMLAFFPTEEITIKGFYSKDDEVELFNTWASYSKDALTLAIE